MNSDTDTSKTLGSSAPPADANAAAFARGTQHTPPDHFVQLLALADIRINGERPWDIQIYNTAFYKRILRDGSIGLAESYMDGWWGCEQLDEFFTRVLRARLNDRVGLLVKLKLALSAVAYQLLNFQSIKRAFHVGEAHYDIGNDLYRRMLDPRMMYSCGYWTKADNLADAQTDKLDLICRKLKLEPGMKLLDIGCGWGGMAAYAAEQYGVEVTGVTISREQHKLACEMVQGLPVDIRLQDYRSLTGHYDRIVSVGMFEHVGVKNYRTFFTKAAELLSDDGLFLLHTIGDEITTKAPEPYIHKYIFPNGKIPSRQEITRSSIDLLRLEDWHNFGPDYDRTLMAWADNINKAWEELPQYDERFQRLWRFYLYSCAGFFRSRQGQLWQLVFTKPSFHHEYRSVR
ncbi:cyclopropane fatty acyl phospholipid synthase [Saccharospirillum sp. MSK14-1]|uniref:cyclopropane fatty acyl phospholipid synthase n=1 Tax=Saccharospirillum sp. MSK14-1 TaxID=1897632 RepID=UPI000D3D5EA9|nr:cyclopropane fatty acyl phospholipid synthase [Saccharospirillum sp. MSK14-1]